MKYLVILLIIASFTSISYAVPQLDPSHAFDYSDIVLVGKVISVEILSEPEVTKTENTSTERLGVVMYEIEAEKYFKTSSYNQTVTVTGLFTREPHGMSYATQPYLQDQVVLLYLQKNTHGYADTDLIIRLGDSQVVKEIICKEGKGVQRDICSVNGRNLSVLKNMNLNESDKFVDNDICGKGTVLVDGICQAIKTDKVGSDAPFFGIFAYLDNLISWIFGK
ncbi:hypothetical protein NKOR_06190 [Candidatus Nitrosopumilus koreensis AR1]|uniref:Uncharacterized protein n=1 Tax=Candidatus Nitrosopumilus koreensis AR1 TaxID=1229908 RepID=K0B6K5_9ARCH|nr:MULTISPECIES: hypothetical protein [Nitrosopumilus]AFS81119.1 hypothetical protein NKOR_06190 [Candidatus Nitrosopumilus koreensis AR1]